MIILKKYKFLILVVFLAAIFTLIVPSSASATHLNFSCFSAEHVLDTCTDSSISSSAFCASSDIVEACVFDSGTGTFWNTACTDCGAFGQACDDITHGCVAPAPTGVPTPTPTPIPSCSGYQDCNSCINGAPNNCGWTGSPTATGSFCQAGTNSCPGTSNWYWLDCITNVCAAAPTATPTPTPGAPFAIITVQSNSGALVDVTGASTFGGTPPYTFWEWNYGDATIDSGPTKIDPIGHTYLTDGTYTITLKVTDSAAKIGTTSIIVTVSFSTPTPTLAPGQLATPTLLLPDNLAIGVSTTPTFTWGSVPLAKAYWVTVNDTTAGTLVVSSSTPINAYTPPVPFVANHAHSWNVQACVNALCSPVSTTDSLVSTTWTFTTAAAVSTPTPTPGCVACFTSSDCSVGQICLATCCSAAPTPTPTPSPTAGPTPTPTPTAPKACFTITAPPNSMIATVTDCSTAGSNPPITRWAWDFNTDGATDQDNSSAPGKFDFDYTAFGPVCGSKKYTATLTIYDSATGSAAVSHDVTVTGSKTDIKGALQCSDAVGDVDGNCKCTEVNTAIGPIKVQGASFVTTIMSLLLGIAGGIAVLLIILAGYTLMTSRDNPEAIQEGRQKLLGAIVGLLFIALALVVLQVIGVNVLQIPGFEP